jgi:hypothetical protein
VRAAASTAMAARVGAAVADPRRPREPQVRPACAQGRSGGVRPEPGDHDRARHDPRHRAHRSKRRSDLALRVRRMRSVVAGRGDLRVDGWTGFSGPRLCGSLSTACRLMNASSRAWVRLMRPPIHCRGRGAARCRRLRCRARANDLYAKGLSLGSEAALRRPGASSSGGSVLTGGPTIGSVGPAWCPAGAGCSR